MTGPAGTRRSRRLLVANLLAQLAFGLLAMTICIPSMRSWSGEFGASQASVQLSFSAFVVAYGGLQLVYGPLSDRIGRQRVLLAGVALAGVGSVLATLAPDLPTLCVARLLQGAGSAAGMVVGRALVQAFFEGPERTRVMAYIGMTLGLCPPLATIIGGQLHVRWGWRANFALMSVLAVLVFVAAWRGLPDDRPAAGAPLHGFGAMLGSYARLAHEPGFVLHVVILACATATFYSFLGGGPIVLAGYGVGPDHIGYYIMCIPVAYIAGNYLTSHWVQRVGDRRMMQLGQVFTVAGVSLMLALGLLGFNTPLTLALPLLLLGFGHGFLMPPTLAGTVGQVPALAGSAAAVAGMMQQVMGAVGAYAVGLFTHRDAINLGCLMLGFTLLAGLALRALRRQPPLGA